MAVNPMISAMKNAILMGDGSAEVVMPVFKR
jgi:hypothetical protein